MIPIISKGTNIELIKDKPSKLNKRIINENATIIKAPILNERPNSSLNIAPLPAIITLKPVYKEKVTIVSIIKPIFLPNKLHTNSLKPFIFLLYIFKRSKLPIKANNIPDIAIPKIPLAP